jgi:hypothetical protein
VGQKVAIHGVEFDVVAVKGLPAFPGTDVVTFAVNVQIVTFQHTAPSKIEFAPESRVAKAPSKAKLGTKTAKARNSRKSFMETF